MKIHIAANNLAFPADTRGVYYKIGCISK